MNPLIIGGLLDIGTRLVEKIFPDPHAASEAKLKLLELSQKGELAELEAAVRMSEAQNRVNEKEAEHRNLFVSGWRPSIGWICGAAFGFKFILAPTLIMIGSVMGTNIPVPAIETSELTTVLLGMLGLGGLRTFEKVKGVA